MKKTGFSAIAALALALLLAACASLLGPREVELPLAKLQEGMARKFPFNNRYLELFDINLTNPRLALQPETNRVITTVDASIAPPFLQRAWKGSFTLSGMLRPDPARNAVVLAEPRMENFSIDGINNAYSSQIGKIGRLLAEQLLDGMAIYTFDPADFRIAGTSYVPTKISTKANGLVVTFEPAG